MSTCVSTNQWLSLKSISTDDIQDALENLLGADAKGLFSNTISRLKKCWEGDYNTWRKRDLSYRHFIYV